MTRFRLTALLVVGVILIGITPAVAIETEAFGFDIVDQSEDRRLHIAIKAGETTTGELRVWNKQDTALRLDLSVTAARVDEGESAALGGDDEAVAWVDVEPSTVELAPKAESRVEVRVAAPRKLDGETKTVAILASPATDGAAPAVLQRLAITTFLEPDEDSLIASLGLLPWIAGIILLVVAAAVVRKALRRTPQVASEGD